MMCAGAVVGNDFPLIFEAEIVHVEIDHLVRPLS
jgi:hypothetical protein